MNIVGAVAEIYIPNIYTRIARLKILDKFNDISLIFLNINIFLKILTEHKLVRCFEFSNEKCISSLMGQ